MSQQHATLAAAALALSACIGVTTNGSPDSAIAPAPVDSAMAAERAFVVDLADGQTERNIDEAAAALFAAVVSVEPLFADADPDDDPFDLAKVYRLRVAGDGPEGGDWDDAYAIRDAGGFLRVEPDANDALVSTTARNAAAFGCIDPPVGPEDRGWSLRQIGLAKARLLTPPAGGKRFGEGVRICHPDTGWTAHVDLDAAQIDKGGGLNLIEGGHDTHDPLGYLGHPGHGTGTGSVLISSGDLQDAVGTTPPGIVVGLAPRASLVPIRAIKSVVQVFDSDIAVAVNHAVAAQCDVISMSLGGTGFFGLERAVKRAVSRDVIVVAAAGNCVDFVVAPASYSDSIAVAATNFHRKPWKGSSKGSAIDISAPGEQVYVAKAAPGTGPHTGVKAGNGTSYATTAVAGSAAVWLAFHGRAAVDQSKRGRTRQALFLSALRQSAENPCAGSSCTWESDKFGPGILNLEKLLTIDLNSIPSALAIPGSDDPISILARMFDRDVASVRSAVNELLGRPADLDAELRQLGPELVDIAARNPDAFRGLLPPQPGAMAPPESRDAAIATVREQASRRIGALIPPAP